MAKSIHPCLWFDGQAKAAAEFYCSLFKNSKITTDTPMVLLWELNGKKFMGLNGGPGFTINPSISIFVNCESIDDSNELWNKLIEGGKALIAIDKYPWSERYGWVQDKFGMTWQVSVVSNKGDKQQIRPSLLFTGNKFGKAEEAVKLYTSLFDHSSVNMIVHYPEGDNSAGKVMYSEFSLEQAKIVAMDGPGDHKYTFNEGVSLVVECESQEEIDHFWNKLTAGGGEESMCGWLKDKFGVSWQIIPYNIGQIMSDKEKGPRAMQAVLKMKKIDMKTLEEA